MYPARILHAYVTYEEARKHISAAEDKSDLSSPESEDVNRGHAKRSRIRQELNRDSSDDAGSEDEVKKSALPALPKFNNSFPQVPPPPSNQILSAPESDISVELHNTGLDADGNQTFQLVETSLFQEQIEYSGAVASLKDLIREVSMIKHTVNNIERKLDNLISSGINQHSTDDEQQPILRQPFESLEEFKEFDAALCNDDKSSLKRYFTKCGGADCGDGIRRMLKKIMIDDVAKLISMKGQKGNFNFSSTSTCPVLIGAALASKQFSTTEAEAEKAISSWFQHATDRLKKNEASKKPKH
ncbi:uncharacterized protein LOC110850476 [Folsomia candida]|uniref:uncharacterized protein LOC110850476 n=1 Tax=Folsomia candida TaxID=158441 RepID=UPI000B8F3EBA|nr:uncharacterized protein LOC110850476 [Folsomia candida]